MDNLLSQWMFLIPVIPLIIVLFFCVSMGVYFLPTILVIRKRDFMAIFLLNLFLGWTFVGWIVCFVLAMTSGNDTPDPTKKCPYCAETIKLDAKLCRFCHTDLEKKMVEPDPVIIDEKEPLPDKEDIDRWNPANNKEKGQ